jgi:hypothetical protein
VKTHEGIDARSLAMARAVVAHIDADPQRTGLDRAKATCRHWLDRGISAAAEWACLLDARPWEEIRRLLLNPSETGRRMRQNSPFCSVLTPKERWAIYREYASHDL